MSNYATHKTFIMKSRITIEVDFDNGKPYMKVLEDPQSDDVRDKLITFFRQQLGCTSSWCKVEFTRHGEIRFWNIRPIKPEDMAAECKIMTEQVRLLQDWPIQDQVSH